MPADGGFWGRTCSVLPLLLICSSIALTLVVDDTASAIWWLLAAAGLFAWFRLRRACRDDRLLRWQLIACGAGLPLFALNAIQADVAYDHIRLFEKFLRWSVLGLVVGLCLSSVRRLRPALLVTAVIALALAGIYGVEQKLDGVDRPGGAVNCIFFGNHLMTLALICLLAALSTWRWWISLPLIACACIGMAVSMWSGTRSSLVALAVLAVLLPWLIRRRPRFWQWSLVPLFLVIAVSVVWVAKPRIVDRLQDGGRHVVQWIDDDSAAIRRTSVGARLSTWQHCLTLWQQEPVSGVGIGDYRREMRALAQIHPRDAANGIIWQHHAHSIYFHLLATTGLLGLSLVCGALLILPAMQFWRILRRVDDPRRRFPAIAGMAVVVSFACYGLTETWVIISAFASAYVTLLAPLLAAAHREWLTVQQQQEQMDGVAVVEGRTEPALSMQMAVLPESYSVI